MEWFDTIERALPPVRNEDYRNECDFYGATDEIAKSLGLTETPVSWAVWSHGWSYAPIFAEHFTWDLGPGREMILVFREDERRLVQQHGHPAVFAVGAPFLYAESLPIPRLSNSLLIMPVHSLDYLHINMDHEAYFAALDPYLSKFDHVAACVHPASIRKGEWIRAFSERGIPYFSGVEIRDRNGLARIRSMMGAFSHVSSNWLGSHIAYAAYCGCSVSVYGPRPRMAREDFRDDPFHVANPHILEAFFERFDNGSYEREYAAFFRPPNAISDDRAWAVTQLGEENKRTPLEMARLFHWTAGLESHSAGLDVTRWAHELGWTPDFERRAPALAERVRELEAQARASERTRVGLDERIEHLERAVEKRDGRVREKSQIVRKKVRKITEMRKLITRKDDELAALRARK